MGIQSWLSLWFGLTLPAIVLMYMFKRKYVDTTVPSHLLWNRVLKNLEANRPWQRLQNRLLLWLQLLAAALLVFALMQPFVRIAGGGSQHLVIVADTSGSMSAEALPVDGEEAAGNRATRLDLLKDRLKAYVKDEARRSDITLITVGARPAALLSRESSRDVIEQAVDRLEPYYGQSSYQEALSLASAVTREENDAEIVVFTDGQWKEDTAQMAFNVPVSVEKISGGLPANLSVEQFGISARDQGGSAVTAVGVISSSTKDLEWAEVSLYGDGKLLSAKEIEVQSGAKATVTFADVPFAEVYRLEISGEDAYSADNEAYAFGQQHGTSRVLLLSSGSLFLEKALQLSGAEVTRISLNNEMEAVPVPEGSYDLLVMDGQVPEAYREGEWAAFAAKTPLWTFGTDGAKVENPGGRPVIAAHPVTSYISLSGVYIGTLLNEKPVWGEPVISLGTTPIVYAGMENGYPRLSFGFMLQDSDLPLSPEFPILVSNALHWMASSSGSGLGRYLAGTVADIPVAADAVKAAWVPKEGLAVTAGLQPAEPVKGEKGYSAAQPVPDIPGLYAFEQENAAGERTSHWIAVEADAFEGNLTADQGPSVVTNSGGVLPSGQTSGGSDVPAGDARDGYAVSSLAPWLAALALLVIAAEWGVYQRGRSI